MTSNGLFDILAWPSMVIGRESVIEYIFSSSLPISYSMECADVLSLSLSLLIRYEIAPQDSVHVESTLMFHFEPMLPLIAHQSAFALFLFRAPKIQTLSTEWNRMTSIKIQKFRWKTFYKSLSAVTYLQTKAFLHFHRMSTFCNPTLQHRIGGGA